MGDPPGGVWRSRLGGGSDHRQAGPRPTGLPSAFQGHPVRRRVLRERRTVVGTRHERTRGDTGCCANVSACSRRLRRCEQPSSAHEEARSRGPRATHRNELRVPLRTHDKVLASLCTAPVLLTVPRPGGSVPESHGGVPSIFCSADLNVSLCKLPLFVIFEGQHHQTDTCPLLGAESCPLQTQAWRMS